MIGVSMATNSQKMAVVLAFAASALSLIAAVVRYAKTGELALTPLAGGLFMFVLGISGLQRLRKPPR